MDDRVFSVVDLFSGAGGMSYGFLQTKRYSIVAAFEADANARKTYSRNHKGTTVYEDVCTASYADIIKVHGDIDVVIGGPPCQGFSNANRQKNHMISKNNDLVKQYIRAIRELHPKAFVMENVAMLKSNKHFFYVSQSDLTDINRYKIPSKNERVLLLEKEFIFDGLLEILNTKKLLEEHSFSEYEYKTLNIIYKLKENKDKLAKALLKYERQLLALLAGLELKHVANKFLQDTILSLSGKIQSYFSSQGSIKDFMGELEQIIFTQRMFSKVHEIYEHDIVFTQFYNDDGIYCDVSIMNVIDYILCILTSSEYGYIVEKGVLKATDFGAPQKRERFVMIGVKKTMTSEVSLPLRNQGDKEDFTVKQAILDLIEVPVSYDVQSDVGIKIPKPKNELNELAKSLRDSQIIFNHIVTKTREVAMNRFKSLRQGENFHDLEDSLKTTYSDAKRTQNTIYLRLNYNAPSGTVVNVRKSMWIHPELDRALSIREAARLQTFPDSFIFEGSKDSQYQQVGNAVPPVLAKAIGAQLVLLLDRKTSPL